MQGINDDNKLHEEIGERFAVDGLLICVNCGSVNTRLLEKGIHCNECKFFRIRQKYYNLTLLQQIILTRTGQKFRRLEEVNHEFI